jgi:hypothetical protein
MDAQGGHTVTLSVFSFLVKFYILAYPIFGHIKEVLNIDYL